MRRCTLALLLALSGACLSGTIEQEDPASQLARVRIIAVTAAPTTDATLGGTTLASYDSTVLNGPSSVR